MLLLFFRNTDGILTSKIHFFFLSNNVLNNLIFKHSKPSNLLIFENNLLSVSVVHGST